MVSDKQKKALGDMGVAIGPDTAKALSVFDEIVLPVYPAVLKPAETNPLVKSVESGKMYDKGAFNKDGKLARLARGDAGGEKFEEIKFLQYELVVNGFLDAKHIAGQEGYMRGTLTTRAVEEVQTAMKAAGAKITVENGHAEKGEKGGVVVFNEVWSSLRALREYGGKAALDDPEKAKQIVARYEEIKAENVKKMLEIKGQAPASVSAVNVNALDLSRFQKEPA